MQLKLQVESQRKYFTVATYIEERKSITCTSFTRSTKETKLFLPHGSGLKYNSLFTKLVIAKRNTVGYFMKFNALVVQSYL